MKKLVCLIVVCLMILLLVGCEETPVGEFTPTEEENTDARFKEIGWERLTNQDGTHLEEVIYYYDEYTNIVYAYFIYWNGNATRGMLTVLYNADGTPMTLDEFVN